MSSNAIVIYRSKTGFTKKYGEMIAEELNCPIAEFKTVTAKTISQYDAVIFGSRAHAGRFDGYSQAKEMFLKSHSKDFILFATGATPNSNEEIIRQFWRQNLSAEDLKSFPHFYMQSGLCYEKMGIIDKMMMRAATVMMKKKKEKTPQDKEFEKAITKSYDISSKKYIMPLVHYYQNLSPFTDDEII